MGSSSTRVLQNATLVFALVQACNTQECSTQCDSQNSQLLQLWEYIDVLQGTVEQLKSKVRAHETVLENILQQRPPNSDTALKNNQNFLRESKEDGSKRQVAQAKNLWSDFFSFKSALHIEASAFESISPELNGGMGKFTFVGDKAGNVHALGPEGEHLSEFESGIQGGISCLHGYSVRHNESVIYMGSSNGVIQKLRVLDEKIEYNQRKIHSWIVSAALRNSTNQHGGTQIIQHLTSIKTGLKRYILSITSAGHLQVYRENATLRVEVDIGDPVFAVKASSMQTVVITKDGPLIRPSLQSSGNITRLNCKGLNGSTLVAAVFDATHKHRAYGLSSDDELLVFFLGGEKKVQDCRVRSRIQTSLTTNNPILLSLPQYLIVAATNGVAIFNITSSHRYPPKQVLWESYSSVGSVLGFSASEIKPMMYVNGKNMVQVLLREDLLFVFQSKLPQSTPPPSNMLKWLPQPIFVCAIIVVGGWQFYKRRQADKRQDDSDFLKQMQLFQQRQGIGRGRHGDIFTSTQRSINKFE